MIMRMVMLFLVASYMPLSAFSFKDLFFKDYSKKAPQDSVTDLQNQQVNRPNDPQINYNLGVALYKTNDFSGAKENFKRALDFGKDTLALRERCYFNLGNTDYQQTMQLLGYDWEAKKIEPQVLDEAIKTITESIENYKNVLVLNKEDEKAQKNKSVAEELLKKLKKKQAEQQNKDKNKDKDNKDDKDSKDKDSENKDGEKGEDKDKNQKDESKDQDKKDEKKDDEEKKENKKDNEQNKNKKGDDKKQQDQQKDEQSKDKPENKPDEKQDKKGQDKQDKENKDEKQGQQPEQQGKDQSEQKEQQQSQADKQEKEKPLEPEKTPQEEKKIQGQQAQPANKQEKKPEDSFEKRQASAILDSLEQQEANLQKALIFRNVHNRQQRQTTNQRPW